MLNSRAVVVFTGCCYVFVGWGFSYLDRRFGSFGLESALWLVWALLGFGAGAVHAGRPSESGQTQWMVLGALGFVLALFPGFAIYNMLRWTSLTLMIVIGARAAILRSRRDFYLTLTVIFVVSFMVGTHGNADWSLWFYLGPAWIFGGLALTWEHASGVRISRWTKASMTLGFIGLSFLLAVTLYFVAPRPPILGFGFFPPDIDAPAKSHRPAGETGSRRAGSNGSGNGDAKGLGVGTGQGSAEEQLHGEWAQQWGTMLRSMRRSLSDHAIPQWQRSAMQQLIDAAQSLLERLTGASSPAAAASAQMEPQPQPTGRVSVKVNWLLWLALTLAGYLIWRRRHRLALRVALGGSWLLASHFPAQSMRLSARAMKWCLHTQGYQTSPGQSVREHWAGAADIAPLARAWLGYAMESYCETRFGNVLADPQRALQMRTAVLGACDILTGLAPELNR